MRILVVEDDELLANSLCQLLAASGHTADRVATGLHADSVLTSEDFELVILDVGLPGCNGFEVLRRLRQHDSDTPVLILTARDTVEDRVHGLDLGADDYLVKPFAARELEARIRALLRRRISNKSGLLVHGALVLNLVTRTATINSKPLELTVREWGLLEFMLTRTGRVISKAKIAEALTGWDQDISVNAVEVYVSRLRAKLEGYITLRTVRGFGYLLENPPTGSSEDH